MSIKATVIGGAPTATTCRPTSLGGLHGGPPPAAAPAPAECPTVMPTTLGAAPVEAVPAQRPTALPVGVPLPKAVEVAPVEASALPGIQRKTVVVSLDELGQRFPGIEAGLKTRIQGLLAGVSPTSMDSGAWLSFGTQAQEAVANLVKDRLALMESAEARAVTQHLSRLQALLGEVLDALGGGFFKKSPQKAWDDVATEVRQLEGLLNEAYPKLQGLTSRIDALVEQNREAGVTLSANALAAEYLTDLVPPQMGSLLIARTAALSTSQALTLEQIQTLELDKTTVQELTVLVQDGVLLKLPAVYSQLAGLSAKTSDTQRFVAVEKLSEIVHHIQRKV